MHESKRRGRPPLHASGRMVVIRATVTAELRDAFLALGGSAWLRKQLSTSRQARQLQRATVASQGIERMMADYRATTLEELSAKLRAGVQPQSFREALDTKPPKPEKTHDQFVAETAAAHKAVNASIASKKARRAAQARARRRRPKP